MECVWSCLFILDNFANVTQFGNAQNDLVEIVITYQ